MRKFDKKALVSAQESLKSLGVDFLNAKVEADQASRQAQKAEANKSEFFMNVGVNYIHGSEDRKDAFFVSLTGGTALDKGLTEVRGVGKTKNGSMPSWILKKVKAFDRWVRPFVVGSAKKDVQALAPGAEKFLTLGSTVSPSKRYKQGMAKAMELGLTKGQAEQLASLFLGLEDPQWAIRIYHTAAETPQKEEEEVDLDWDDAPFDLN